MTEPARDGEPPAVRPPAAPRIPFEALRRSGLPPAAANSTDDGGRPALRNLYLLTLLSAVDGSLIALSASGQLSTWGGAVAVGLTVIAGAGSWIAAERAFGGRRLTGSDLRALGLLGLATLAATATSVWLGMTVSQAVTLHVMPKAAGLAMCFVAAEVAGVRLPRLARVPLPIAALALAVPLEVGAQWMP
jgi:hypothetical protein